MHSTNQHFCKQLPPKGVAVYPARSFELASDGWIVQVFREAEAEDLELNHLLENEGQLIEYVTFPVAYCPYCGLRLGSNENESLHNEPLFWHLE